MAPSTPGRLPFRPEGSKHTVEVRQPRQVDASGSTSLKFASFAENSTLLLPSGSQIQQITVDARVTSYLMTFVREFRVDFYINYDSLDNWQAGATTSGRMQFRQSLPQ